MLVLSPGHCPESPSPPTTPCPRPPGGSAGGPNTCVYVASLAAALGGLLFGYDVGVISGARGQVARQLGLSCAQQEALVAAMPLGAVLATVGPAHTAMDRWGRRAAIQASGFLFLVGSLLLATSSSLALLLAGRLVVGAAVSLSAMAECTYIAEIVGPEIRGRMVTLNELGITLGFLLAYIVDFIFVTVDQGWSFIAVIQLVAFLFLPETPQFLVMKGREEEAERVLSRFHNRERSGLSLGREVAQMTEAAREEGQASCSNLFGSELNMRKRMVVGLGLVVAQQLTGQANILTYAGDIFKSVGYCGDLLAALATVLVGCVKVVSTLVSLATVDRVGRRLLLVCGTAVMLLCLVCLVSLSLVIQHSLSPPGCAPSPTLLYNSSAAVPGPGSGSASAELCQVDEASLSLRPLALAGVLLFVAAYSLSFGPVTWILLTELFPAPLKSRAMCLAQASNWAVNVLVSVTFLDLVSWLGLPMVLSSYALATLLTLGFVVKCVPETKNKTLHQLDRELADKGALGRSADESLVGNLKQGLRAPGFNRLEEESCEEA